MAKTLNCETVSEYIKAGGMSTGYTLMERPARETEKALAFDGIGHTVYGNPAKRLGWFPKSKAVTLANDYYTNDAPLVMFAFPNWLIAAKKAEGWEIA